MGSILDLIRPTPASIQQMIMQQQLAKQQGGQVNLSMNGQQNPDYATQVQVAAVPRPAQRVSVEPMGYEPTTGSEMEADSHSSIDNLMAKLEAQRNQSRVQDRDQQWMSFFSKLASSKDSSLLGGLGEGAQALTETTAKQASDNKTLDSNDLTNQIKVEQWKQEQALKEETLNQGKYDITADGLGGFLKINKKTGETETVGNPMSGTASPGVDEKGNPLTGDAYLSTLDPRIAKTAKMVANGDMPWPGGFALKSPYWQNVIAAAQTYDPSANGNRFPAVKAFNTGTQGNTVRSFDVAISHLDTLGELSDALKNNDVKSVNRVANTWKSETGNPAPTNFNAAKEIVADELVKAIVGSGSGALGDRESIKKTVSEANSPEQLNGVIATYKSLMGGQITGLKQQYENSTGRKDFLTRVSPKSAKEIKKLLSPTTGDKDTDVGKPDAGSYSHLSDDDLLKQLGK